MCAHVHRHAIHTIVLAYNREQKYCASLDVASSAALSPPRHAFSFNDWSGGGVGEARGTVRFATSLNGFLLLTVHTTR